MPQVLIRDVDEETLERLKQRAQRSSRSLQAELKLVLEEAAARAAPDYRAELARVRARFGNRTFSDSTELIREDRDR